MRLLNEALDPDRMTPSVGAKHQVCWLINEGTLRCIFREDIGPLQSNTGRLGTLDPVGYVDINFDDGFGGDQRLNLD